MTRQEMIESAARAWATMDGNLDRFEACRADPRLEMVEGRYRGYFHDAEALLEGSGILDLADKSEQERNENT
ncbi:MAG: hypothetical protein AAGF94_11010 [Pseudomonadota bacterium]